MVEHLLPKQDVVGSSPICRSMTLTEAFKHQLDKTRLLVEDDLADDTEGPVVWNGVILRPDGNFYSSRKEMKVGDKLIVAYFISNTQKPVALMLEESEIGRYEKELQVVRVVDNIPILSAIDQSDDQYDVESLATRNAGDCDSPGTSGSCHGGNC
jgi:hypothetical protein